MNLSNPKRKQHRMLAFALVFGSFLLLTTGCVKNILSNGTITIKGKLVQDCSGTPIAGKPLGFYLKIGGSKTGGTTEMIGTDTTDQDGNFQVTGTNFGDGYLLVYHDFGGPQSHTYAGREIDGGNGSTVDLGIVYDKFDYSVAVKFSRTVSNLTDTLYFGDYANQPAGSAVGSEINDHVYYVIGQMNGSENQNPKEATWVWGIGMADYQKAIDSMYSSGQSQNQPPFHRIFNVRVGVCKDDTSFVKLSH